MRGAGAVQGCVEGVCVWGFGLPRRGGCAVLSCNTGRQWHLVFVPHTAAIAGNSPTFPHVFHMASWLCPQPVSTNPQGDLSEAPSRPSCPPMESAHQFDDNAVTATQLVRALRSQLTAEAGLCCCFCACAAWLDHHLQAPAHGLLLHFLPHILLTTHL